MQVWILIIKSFTLQKQSTKHFTLTKHIVYAMCARGQGYAELEWLTTLLNMPRPMTKMNFNQLVEKITNAVVDVANDADESQNSKLLK